MFLAADARARNRAGVVPPVRSADESADPGHGALVSAST
jgi:hypothetical protein